MPKLVFILTYAFSCGRYFYQYNFLKFFEFIYSRKISKRIIHKQAKLIGVRKRIEGRINTVMQKYLDEKITQTVLDFYL